MRPYREVGWVGLTIFSIHCILSTLVKLVEPTRCSPSVRVILVMLYRYMGVSTTGERGKTFPTRILTLEIYWGIFPVKIRFRPDISPVKIQFRSNIDPLTFDV